ncbi:MAG: mechanosensitive ion channel [Deltaproteobacteria bacterium]
MRAWWIVVALWAVAAPANAQPSDGGARDGGAVAPPAGPRAKKQAPADRDGGGTARSAPKADGDTPPTPRDAEGGASDAPPSGKATRRDVEGGAADTPPSAKATPRDAEGAGASGGDAPSSAEGEPRGAASASDGEQGRAPGGAEADGDASPPNGEAGPTRGAPRASEGNGTTDPAAGDTNAPAATRAGPARDGGTPVDIDAFVGPPMSAAPPPPTMGPKLARPAGPARSRPKREKVAVAKKDPEPAEADPPDAGVRDGGAREAFVGPPPREAPTEPQEEGLRDLIARIVKAQWSFLRVLLFAFIVFRIAALVVRRMARANHQLALVLSRLWVFVEATGWAAIGVWLFTRLSQTESTVTAGLAGLVVLALIALSWGAIKDVIAGLMISAERPFTVGDHVSVGEAAGQVRNFRTRVLELETDDGHVVRVPYRHVSGATDVRRGGRRTAHAVALTLELPETLGAVEALDLARELASSSPWSVLGVAPKLRLDEGHTTPKIVMEAYAFDREAGPLLHADLLSGWREAQRKG